MNRGHRLRLGAAVLLAVLAAGAAAQGGRRGNGAEFRDLGDRFAAAERDGDLALAEDLARARVALAENGGPPKMLGNAYRNLGSVLRQRGKFADAEVILRKSLVLVERGNGRDSFQAIRVLLNLGNLLTAQSRFQDAEVVLRDALERQLAAAPRDKDAIQAYNALANVERQLGRYAEAETLLHGAEAVPAVAADSRDGRSEEAWIARYREKTDYQLARLFLQQGKNEAAAAHAQRAVAAQAARGGDDNPDLVQSLTVLGTAALHLHRLDAAESALRRALSIGERKLGKAHKDTGQAAMFLGLALAQRGRGDEAGALLQRAVDSAHAADALEPTANFERLLGRFLVAQQQPVAALAHYRNALDAVDRLFAQTQGIDEATRENFVAQFAAFYYEALQLLTQLHRSQPQAGYDREALAVVSRTQSRLFTELLRRADTGKLAADPAFNDLHARQLAQKTRLAELRQARVLAGKEAPAAGDDAPPTAAAPADPLVQARIDAHRASIAADTETAARDLARTEAALWEKYPRYMELTQPRPVTVDMLQKQLLKPDETLLSYFLLPKSALIFVVAKNDFHMLQTPVAREDIAAWIAAARQPEEAAAASFDNLARLDPANLHRLYGALFEPVLPYVKDGQRLLVIGDGPLHTLPLEMLVTRYGEPEQRAFAAARAQRNGPALAEYATLPYLGEHYRFAYLPSLSALASVRLYRKPAVRYDKELVSFADPLFEKASRAPAAAAALAVLARSVRHEASLSIPRLPETADEARAIATILGGRSDVFLRERAQEHTAKTLDLRTTRYLHFATHGLLGGEFVQVHDALAAMERDGAAGGARNIAVAAAPADAALPELGDDEPPVAAASEHGQPALVLSLGGDLQGEDGLLTMGEVIASMDLNAQLVVLSACNTAGEGAAAKDGEGFAGLTRAFMYAGAQGLLVSHWSVESRSTQELVTEMFRRLHGGAENLAALADARSLIRGGTLGDGAQKISRSHPYFWAPFVYVGD
ncbi:MAG: CHAT domain-containing protein [Rhodocyclaceae bacterium]|nr:CHAT domain-containing protein [Rhodocyclaceae bacterium]